MTFQKYLIIASKVDPAGVNITTQLSQFRENPVLSSMKQGPNFDFYLIDTPIIDDSGIDKERLKNYDFIIFASKHESEKREKTLSIHAPGNFRDVGYGGEQLREGASQQKRAGLGGVPKKICPSSAQFQKQMFEKLNKNATEHHLLDYKITLECTHHGPLIDKPCVFIEIGATINEWNNRKAGFIIAKTIKDIINEFKPNPYNEIGIGVGGPHYCPNFNKIQLNSNVALSHVIPQWSLPLTEEMVKEALDKTTEEVDFAVIDWKGLGNAEQRNQALEVLDKLYVRYKKTGEISK